MKIKVLPSASQDLVDGYWFYEKQSPGLGSYFKDTLFSDIDSLSFLVGFILYILRNTTVCSQRGFHLQFIIRFKTTSYACMRYSIAAEILPGYGAN